METHLHDQLLDSDVPVALHLDLFDFDRGQGRGLVMVELVDPRRRAVLAGERGRIRGIRSTTGAKPALMVPIVPSAWSNSAYRSRCSDTLRRRSGKSQPRRERAGRVKGATNVTRERRSAPLTRPSGRAELKDRSDAAHGRTPAYAGARLARDRTCAVTASVYVYMATLVAPAMSAICSTPWTRPCARFVQSKS